MSIPDRDQTQEDLAALNDGLYKSAHQAWDDWEALGAQRGGLGKTSRANFIHDRWLLHAETILCQNHLIRPEPFSTTKYFSYQGRYLLRLKKGNRKGLSRNYQTQLAMAFNDPRQLMLPGIPDCIRLDVVYILSALETHIEDIRVVARDGKSIAWQYSISPAVMGELAELPLMRQDTHQRSTQVRLVNQESSGIDSNVSGE